MMNTHREWLNEVTGGESLRQVDARTKLNYSTLSRQLREGRPLTADQVLIVARAYNAEPIQALRDTGYLEPHEGDPQLTAQMIANRIARDAQTLAQQAQTTTNPTPIEQEDNERILRILHNPYDDNDDDQQHHTADDQTTGDHMPEDAVAYDGIEWGDPDDDHDH
ncbi:hypothetical protein [Corynebacterium kalidii]